MSVCVVTCVQTSQTQTYPGAPWHSPDPHPHTQLRTYKHIFMLVCVTALFNIAYFCAQLLIVAQQHLPHTQMHTLFNVTMIIHIALVPVTIVDLDENVATLSCERTHIYRQLPGLAKTSQTIGELDISCYHFPIVCN